MTDLRITELGRFDLMSEAVSWINDGWKNGTLGEKTVLLWPASPPLGSWQPLPHDDGPHAFVGVDEILWPTWFVLSKGDAP